MNLEMMESEDANSKLKYAGKMNKILKEKCRNTNDVEQNWRHIVGCVNEHIGITRDIKRQEWYNQECHNMIKKKK